MMLIYVLVECHTSFIMGVCEIMAANKDHSRFSRRREASVFFWCPLVCPQSQLRGQKYDLFCPQGAKLGAKPGGKNDFPNITFLVNFLQNSWPNFRVAQNFPKFIIYYFLSTFFGFVLRSPSLVFFFVPLGLPPVPTQGAKKSPKIRSGAKFAPIWGQKKNTGKYG